MSSFFAALLVGVIYVRTLHPGVGPTLDSIEYQIVVAVLGIPHPTGNPLYILLGRLFTLLVPVGNLAWRLNLFSAVCAVGTVVLIQQLVHRLTRSLPASLFAALSLGLAVRFWYQAVITEVSALNSLCVAAVLYLLAVWHERRRPWLYFLTVAVYALSFGNHLSMVLLLPGFVYTVLVTDRRMLTRPGNLALMALVVLAGAAQYLYVPLRVAANPPFCNYCPREWAALPDYLTGGPWHGAMFGVPREELLGRVLDTVQQWHLQFLPWGYALGVIGAWELIRQRVRLAGTLLLGLGVEWLFVATYDIVDWPEFMTPVYVIFAPLMGVGANAIWQWLAGLTSPRRSVGRWAVGGGLVLLAALSLCLVYDANHELVDHSQRIEWHDWARELLGRIEPGGWVLMPPVESDGFVRSWALRYVSWAEQVRPEMTVVALPRMQPPGPRPYYLRWEEAADRFADQPVYAVELNDPRLEGYALAAIEGMDGSALGYQLVAEWTPEGARPLVSPERWAEVRERILP